MNEESERSQASSPLGGEMSQTWVEKGSWPSGPWQDEPDRVEWEENGYPCLALRNPSWGVWCGYVAVPSGHPWHGKGCDDVPAEVHGRLTYADSCMEDVRPLRERVCHAGPEGVWWLGFDCAHCWDVIPAFGLGPAWVSESMSYKPLPYVLDQIRSLREQASHVVRALQAEEAQE